MLATHTYPPGITRAQVKIRAVEGQHGTLKAYIVPRTEPKVCTERQYKLAALSLHQRVMVPFDDSRPVNTLTLTGDFGFADIHSWVAVCLPGVPERLQVRQFKATAL